ncbi:MAG: hypothetical protein AABX39_02635 [Nanoarchaeota archaeon]
MAKEIAGVKILSLTDLLKVSAVGVGSVIAGIEFGTKLYNLVEKNSVPIQNAVGSIGYELSEKGLPALAILAGLYLAQLGAKSTMQYLKN